MKYNFDAPTNRKNTGSLKWDIAENELPMWVADMGFETAPAVKEAIKKTAERGIFGYSIVPDEYFESIRDFFERRYSYRFETEWMVYTNGIVAAISSMVRKLTTPAENVLLQPPVYNIFYNCIRNNGRCVLENKLIYENGFNSQHFDASGGSYIVYRHELAGRRWCSAAATISASGMRGGAAVEVSSDGNAWKLVADLKEISSAGVKVDIPSEALASPQVFIRFRVLPKGWLRLHITLYQDEDELYDELFDGKR